MLGFRRKKINIIQAGWLNGLSEIHCHLLPTVDDGCVSTDETRQILACYHRLGIVRVGLSPHIVQTYPTNTAYTLRTVYDELLASLAAWPSEGSDIELSLGAEYKMDDSFAERMTEPILRIGSSDYILVETSFWGPSLTINESLHLVQVKGYRPLLAHPERYLYLKPEEYTDLKHRGCAFQLNLFALTGMYGREVAERATSLAKEGLYDYVGLDTHHIHALENTIESALMPATMERVVRNLIAANDKLFL